MSNVGQLLCVHPNAELYGSDKVFLRTVKSICLRNASLEVKVVLGDEGDLQSLLEETGCLLEIRPGMVVRRDELRKRPFRTMLAILNNVFTAIKDLKQFDAVYISSTASVAFIIASMFVNSRITIHVHELSTHLIERLIFSFLLRVSGARVLFISEAVRNAYWFKQGRTNSVLPNGTELVESQKMMFRPSEKIHILMVGRFNAWKGQQLLVEAVSKLSPEEIERVEVRFVGSSFRGQESFVAETKQLVLAKELSSVVFFENFHPEIDQFYKWSNIVVVPSIKPEPFGLVAIEAMSYRRCVLVANHGGLSEIVDGLPESTKFSPGSVVSLASKLSSLICNQELMIELAEQGYRKFQNSYREDIYDERINSELTS